MYTEKKTSERNAWVCAPPFMYYMWFELEILLTVFIQVPSGEMIKLFAFGNPLSMLSHTSMDVQQWSEHSKTVIRQLRPLAVNPRAEAVEESRLTH